jgi:hypothetical protein
MNYRNPKLLRLAQEAPECFHCQKRNDGSVVAAHSNQIRDGKGTGIKADDFRIAYLCAACHTMVDSSKKLSRFDRIQIWEEAHRRSIGWLFETGRVTCF